MKGMQEHTLEAIKFAMEDYGFEAIVKTQWSNTGRVYAMDGLTARWFVTYDFQNDYCGLKLFRPQDRPGWSNHVAGANHIDYGTELEMAVTQIAIAMEVHQEEGSEQ